MNTQCIQKTSIGQATTHFTHAKKTIHNHTIKTQTYTAYTTTHCMYNDTPYTQKSIGQATTHYTQTHKL